MILSKYEGIGVVCYFTLAKEKGESNFVAII